MSEALRQRMDSYESTAEKEIRGSRLRFATIQSFDATVSLGKHPWTAQASQWEVREVCRIQTDKIERKAEEKLFTRHEIRNIEETKAGRREAPRQEYTAVSSIDPVHPNSGGIARY